jgi:hypothetical protein
MSKGTFWDDEGVASAMIFCGNSQKEIINCLKEVETKHFNTGLYMQRKQDIESIRESMSLSSQAELAIETLLNHPKIGIPNRVISGSLWSYAKSGAPRSSNISGIRKRIYFWVVTKPILPKFLILLGVRVIWRKFRIRRELRSH